MKNTLPVVGTLMAAVAAGGAVGTLGALVVSKRRKARREADFGCGLCRSYDSMPPFVDHSLSADRLASTIADVVSHECGLE